MNSYRLVYLDNKFTNKILFIDIHLFFILSLLKFYSVAQNLKILDKNPYFFIPCKSTIVLPTCKVMLFVIFF